MIWRLMRFDMKQLLRDRMAILVLMVGVLASGVTGWIGHVRILRATASHNHVVANSLNEAEAFRKQVASTATEMDASTLALSVSQSIALPVPRLLDFTAGRSTMSRRPH